MDAYPRPPHLPHVRQVIKLLLLRSTEPERLEEPVAFLTVRGIGTRTCTGSCCGGEAVQAG